MAPLPWDLPPPPASGPPTAGPLEAVGGDVAMSPPFISKCASGTSSAFGEGVAPQEYLALARLLLKLALIGSLILTHAGQLACPYAA